MKFKIKRVLSFILSLIICFSFFPNTVFGNVYKNPKIYISARSSGNSIYSYADDVSIPYYLTSSNSQAWYYFFSIESLDTYSLEVGDTVTITVELNNGDSSRYSDFEFCYVEIEHPPSGSGSYVDCVSEIDGEYDPSTSTFTYKGTVDLSGSDECSIRVGLSNPTISNANTSTLSFGCTKFTVNIESAQTGFFNSVKEFFQQLFDKLTSGLDNIGTWFSELGNKLSNFFSDLVSNIKEQFTNMIDNLKSFFSDVGDWFSEIGDRIGSFFTDLWDNITVKIEGITDSIHDWWQSIVDFFRNLFVPEEGYFDKYKEDWETWGRAHFALFYDVKDIITDLFGIFTSVQGTPDDYITIPEVKLPFLENKTIIPETRFDLTDFVNSSDIIYFIYETYQFFAIFIGFSLIIKYLLRTFSQILTGDGDSL